MLEYLSLLLSTKVTTDSPDSFLLGAFLALERVLFARKKWL